MTDNRPAIALVTASANRSMLLPALIPIAIPAIAGIISYKMLGGLLIGTIVTGLFLRIIAILMIPLLASMHG